MRDALRRLASGELSVAETERLLLSARIAELPGLAALDIDRARRVGVPEVVLAAGKRPSEVAAISALLLDRTGEACVSRMRSGHRRAVEQLAVRRGATLTAYGRSSARLTAVPPVLSDTTGLVGLIAAGTSDLDVLGEARMVVEAAGCPSATVADVGVAGLHRLMEPLANLMAAGACVLVVAAGMDGALPSVVSGLVDVPIVGLPVSTGYGAGGRGRAALLAMLQTC
ncbi:MAG TPA: AIR carboxylase family protein, partial [Candidatus Dormibacteraeota bacterium]|nr:AIR carboxylase family protein [Candidatus Dormibacteraeota bacterium]